MGCALFISGIVPAAHVQSQAVRLLQFDRAVGGGNIDFVRSGTQSRPLSA